VTPDALAALIASLKAAGVREAQFHADGSPARLVFSDDPAPPAEAPAEPSGERHAPVNHALAHSRLRPKGYMQ
jgi:hypothetical protein